MSAKKRLIVLLGSAGLFLLAGGRPVEAQWSYPYPAPYRYAIDRGSAVRLEVTPNDAEVFVDGYYAGVVDDFDGVFQRLRVAPGAHEITVYLPGYRTLTERVYLTPNGTLKIKREMDRLGAGEVSTLPPTPVEPNARPEPGPEAGPPVPPRGPAGRRLPPPPPNGPSSSNPSPRPPAEGQSSSGTLSIHVQPGDAEILIDGMPWHAPQGSDALTVDLPDGHHTVQVRKQGYVAYLTDVQVRRGEMTPLDVNLRTQP